jgi:hypothetical protein
MDGRPHPPANAVHTWSGFSTGVWEGDVLVVTTTHLKETYSRRSGLMRSDQATVRTRWRRVGDYVQATSILYDPVQLTEPYVRSTMMWRFDPAMQLPPYPCEEATETAVPRGNTPHFLPGQSPLPGLDPKATDRFGTPHQPRLGGAETMYPEYIARMKAMPRPATLSTDTGASGNQHLGHLRIVGRRGHLRGKQFQLMPFAGVVEDVDRLQPPRLRRIIQLTEMTERPLARAIRRAHRFDQRPVGVPRAIFLAMIGAKKHRRRWSHARSPAARE